MNDSMMGGMGGADM